MISGWLGAINRAPTVFRGEIGNTLGVTWVKPLVTITLILLDFGLVALFILQGISRQPINWGLVWPALGFNVFGAVILWAVNRDD